LFAVSNGLSSAHNRISF